MASIGYKEGRTGILLPGMIRNDFILGWATHHMIPARRKHGFAKFVITM